MLPNIVSEDGGEAVGDWVVLVWRADDRQIFVCILHQPDPAASESLYATVIELLLEVLEAAEC